MNAHNNGSVSLKKMTKDMEKYLGLPKKVLEKLKTEEEKELVEKAKELIQK